MLFLEQRDKVRVKWEHNFSLLGSLRVHSCSFHVQLRRCKVLLLLEGDLVLAFAFPSDVISFAVADLMLFRTFNKLFEFTKWSKMV